MNTKEELRAQIDKIDKLKKLNFENIQKDVWTVGTLRSLEACFDARHVRNFNKIFNHACVITDELDWQKEYLKELEKAKEFLYTIIDGDRIVKQTPRGHKKMLY